MSLILVSVLAVGLRQAAFKPASTSTRAARIPRIESRLRSFGPGAKRIAVFGSNTTLNLLATTPGYEPVVVSDAEVATPGFLDRFDALFYTRDGTLVSFPMSDAAAENVRKFVTGNVALFATDLADKIGSGAPDGEDPLANRAFLNALAYATAGGSGKGFIGELAGTWEAMGPRLRLLPGNSGSVTGTNGAGLYQPFRVTQPGNPIVGHLPERWTSRAGMDWIVATNQLPAANVLAVGPAGGGFMGIEHPTVIIGQVSGRKSSVTLTINPSEAPQSTRVQGTVFLDAAARAETRIQLITNSSAATAPLSVSVPKGASEASFWIQTKAVSQVSDVAVTALRGQTASTAYLRVLPLAVKKVSGPTQLRDGQDESRTVSGIVCDNLSSTPADRKNKLILKTAGAEAPREVYAYFYSGRSGDEPLFSAPHLGQVSLEGGKVTYFPPFEYNTKQTPASLADITGSATRSLWVELLVRSEGGQWIRTPRTSITLARPPLILVHGINSSPGRWDDFNNLLRQKGIGYAVATVDHSGVHSGRGGVENAAALLDEKIGEVVGNVRAGRMSPITPNGALAIRRVDLVAWSYGGVISRWYLADRPGENSLDWYHNTSTEGMRKPAAYDDDVRKLITVASMWRGVPLTNVMNEINATSLESHHFGDAPILGQEYATLADFVNVIGPLGDSTYPAWQVMGVESPWLRWMLSRSGRGPFRENVGYGSVAGDDSDYPVVSVKGVRGQLNFYQALVVTQKPSWFPYLNLEVASGQDLNYSDGLVPVWSAAIPGEAGRSYRIVEADHSDVPWHPEAFEYTLAMLNSTSIMTGQDLEPHWNSGTVAARGDKYRWTFDRSDRMAPSPQNRVYDQVGGMGRLNVAAVRELNTLHLESASRKEIVFTFHAAVAPNGGKVFVEYFANGLWHSKLLTWASSQLTDGLQRVTVPMLGATPGMRIRLATVIWERRIGSSIVELRTAASNEVKVQ